MRTTVKQLSVTSLAVVCFALSIGVAARAADMTAEHEAALKRGGTDTAEARRRHDELSTQHAEFETEHAKMKEDHERLMNAINGLKDALRR